MRLSGKNSLKTIVFRGEDGQKHFPRLELVLEDGAQATVLEIHEGEGTYQKTMSTEIVLKDNAQLTHVRIQKDSADAVYVNTIHSTLGENARLNCFTLNMGAKLLRHDIRTILNNEGAECWVNGLNLLNSSQHCDTTIVMEHLAPRCTSHQFYRSIIDDNAQGVFQGKIYVHKDAQKTDGYQLSNALLLSQDAQMKTKPELEIYADDVKCSHGTTTGQLDEEPLFYLRSRGLNEIQARMLLVQAFMDEVIDKIKDKALCSRIKDMAEEWLIQQLK